MRNAGRRRQRTMRPDCGRKPCARILGAQPRLDRVAAALEARERFVLRQRQRLAGGDAQLPLDQVDAEQRLGHRVLDLQPGVHLDEAEVARRVEQELDRAGAAVADRARDRDRDLAHAPAQRRRDRRRGRFLDQLLVPPLHRAVALAEVDRRGRARRRRPGSRRGARSTTRARAAAGRRRTRARLRRAADASAAASSPLARTSRMPRPPPPAAALTISGKPIRCASARSVAASCAAPS